MSEERIVLGVGELIVAGIAFLTPWILFVLKEVKELRSKKSETRDELRETKYENQQVDIKELNKNVAALKELMTDISEKLQTQGITCDLTRKNVFSNIHRMEIDIKESMGKISKNSSELISIQEKIKNLLSLVNKKDK